jgi:hypothetical protein
MAQHPKARTQEEQDLRDAVVFAEKRLDRAKEAKRIKPSVRATRELQVATDELKALRLELRKYETDRDPESIRRQDASPRRSKSSWPVGKAYDPTRTGSRREKSARPEKEKPPLPPPTKRPDVLSNRIVPAANGQGTEKVSWWVGVDRSTLNGAAKTLAQTPVTPTSRPATKAATKTAAQQTNDAKRDAKRAAGRSAAGKLQDKLKPTMGAFSSIPMAE